VCLGSQSHSPVLCIEISPDTGKQNFLASLKKLKNDLKREETVFLRLVRQLDDPSLAEMVRICINTICTQRLHLLINNYETSWTHMPCIFILR
jgi:hypothetical protein